MTIRKTGAAADQVIYDEARLAGDPQASITAEASAAQGWTADDEDALAEEGVD